MQLLSLYICMFFLSIPYFGFQDMFLLNSREAGKCEQSFAIFSLVASIPNIIKCLIKPAANSMQLRNKGFQILLQR